MKQLSLGAGVLALVALAACSDGRQDSLAPDLARPVAIAPTQAVVDEFVPGDVIVRFREGVDAAEVGRAHGLALGETGRLHRFSVMRAAPGSEMAAIASLRSDPRVLYAEPNYLRHPDAVDPRLWAFFNPGGLNMKFTSGGSKGQTLGAAYASTADADEDNIAGYAAGGSDVVVGSIDTGVQMNHVEFTGRLIAGKDWYNNDNDPSDDDGHGSHTTGTMAGTTVGVAGISGAAPHVRVYVQKVCGRRGCPTTAIVSAIMAAADYPNMVAMNVSIGGAGESQAEKDAIAYATGKGVLVIASAGNSAVGTVECPACDANAISVAATQWQDKLASYSNWGPGLDIAAPGGNCYSNTTPDGCIYSAYTGGGYSWLQGTSMAAPQVTGTAAVVASVTGLRGSALRSRILSTADDLGAAGYDNSFGNGRLNTYRAVTNGSLAAGL
jgi:subtilisin family serine protease